MSQSENIQPTDEQLAKIADRLNKMQGYSEKELREIDTVALIKESCIVGRRIFGKYDYVTIYFYEASAIYVVAFKDDEIADVRVADC